MRMTKAIVTVAAICLTLAWVATSAATVINDDFEDDTAAVNVLDVADPTPIYVADPTPGCAE